ncbi:flavodoxin family protein [Kitasatospora cineracea]|uniref:Multimeric flavodoxin WrbA n=1 Tax=Kitasatospora cineracea TaxID=88074 RepID=A0A8G1X7W8_9ACTN|nr:NAD(P)H-dependent oxidoreductase [Kitasatospora cineracea]ROR35834.1 multimeric flavodoxin WrbA [Kitasatospora cineracea]
MLRRAGYAPTKRALIVNCTLKPSPAPSNTEALAAVVVAELASLGVEADTVRAVDLDLRPGVKTDMGDGDQWPGVHDKLLAADILVVASPTWVGRPSSIAQRVLERMDAMVSETDEDGRPAAAGKVAGVVVTGNEDGAHHVISEICGALVDIGYTIPAQAWTYWHLGPGPGPDYLDDDKGHEWAHTTGRTMARNLHHVATALTTRPWPAPAQ